MADIVIPYEPRPLQRAIHDGMDRSRFGAAVCHRRFGKTVCAVNHLQKGAVQCRRPRPRFAYIAPTYTQGKAIAWDYMRYYARPIPGMGINISELRVDYPHGGQVRIFGADNPDSLRGLYFDGVVLDEYGLMPPRIFTEVIRPTLSDREGWALFLGTPNGKNQFYDVVQTARNHDDWFFAEYKASETGILTSDELASARASMTADEYAQEYECSFEASVKGAVYARELQASREAGRITRVPYDPALPVDTTWDLGVGDATAIWFTQSLTSSEIRVIDYYESSGEGLSHYREVLNRKNYAYGLHWAPFDIEVRELGTGHSRKETAAQLGLNFQVVPRIAKNTQDELAEGIHAVRMTFPRCWFDAEQCQAGLVALQHYHWDFNKRIKEFKTSSPVHDWASHGADAFRYFAVHHQTPKVRPEKDKDETDDWYERVLKANPIGKRVRLGRGGY